LRSEGMNRKGKQGARGSVSGQSKEMALLEIGVEDIPASYFPAPLEQLKRGCEEALAAAELPYERVKVLATLRRLAVIIEGVVERARPSEREVKGPPASAAFDGQGNPTAAAIGFAKSQGVETALLVRKATEKGEYVFAQLSEEGRLAEEVLPEIWDRLIRSVTFPKTMRWEGKFRFVRPIRWLVGMMGSREVPLSFEGLRAGATTCGHRFISPAPVSLGDAKSYVERLREAGVLVDPQERRKAIEAQGDRLAETVGGRLYGPDGLMEETVFMGEHPTLFLGRFDPEFLGLPGQVLTTIMRKHQRYFAVLDGEGRALPYFIALRDGDDCNLEEIRKANERVLRARLKDGVFFFQQDMRHKLEDLIPKLEKITFQEGLGTMRDKAARLSFVVARIGELAGLDDGAKEAVGRAAWLCKTDLVTDMVRELPELQGVVGGEYARLQGETEVVAKAIGEHYLPQSSDDPIPTTVGGQIISLADKLDTLCACLSIGLSATGSEDPYGLRRNAQGVVRVIAEGEHDLSLAALVEIAFEGLAEGGITSADEEGRKGEALAFLTQRMQQWLLDKGLPRDVVNAAMGPSADRPQEVRERGSAIASLLREDKRMTAFAIAATRVINILRAKQAIETLANRPGGPDAGLFQEEAERELWSVHQGVAKAVAGLDIPGDYGRLLDALMPLVEPINKFFDDVMVMVEDERLRANRLALLREVRSVLDRFGDLSQLEVER